MKQEHKVTGIFFWLLAFSVLLNAFMLGRGCL